MNSSAGIGGSGRLARHELGPVEKNVANALEAGESPIRIAQTLIGECHVGTPMQILERVVNSSVTLRHEKTLSLMLKIKKEIPVLQDLVSVSAGRIKAEVKSGVKIDPEEMAREFRGEIPNRERRNAVLSLINDQDVLPDLVTEIQN
ncbi:MAG: hypothetical protein ACI9BD_000292 [Candidatus Marinamargulisbacteria bacterium]|jgi:hypothetical protein